MAVEEPMPDVLTEAVAAAARNGEPERYLAALYAGASARSGLLALAAFAAEIARVPFAVREPLMGEMRLQWWRDALEADASAQTGSPLADALRQAANRHRLPAGLLLGMTDAQEFFLSRDAHHDLQALRAQFGKSEGAHFVLAARVLGSGHASELESAAAAAGQAFGLARLLHGLPHYLAHGMQPLPAELLERHGVASADLLAGRCTAPVRGALAELARDASDNHAIAAGLANRLPRTLRPAFLPLATVPALLKAAAGRGEEGLRVLRPVNPLGRFWRIWRASRRGFAA